jgi:stress-induced-phosphoprotein 1
MPDKEKAAEAKAKGNKDFQAKNYKEAIGHFTEAIKHDPTDHVFFSNRSACYASLEEYEKALEDGSECVKLKPDWPKGYTRKAHAEFFLKKFDEAAETYKAGIKLSPDDAALKEGLQKCMDAKYDLPGAGPSYGGGAGGGGGGGPGLKFDPSALAAASAKNPKIKEYMADKALMEQVNMVMQLGQQNPQMQQTMLMQLMQKDPRILEVIMAMQGIDVNTASPEDFGEPGQPAPRPAPKKAEPPPPPPDLRTPEQKEADEHKTKANALYKEKKFEEALVEYDKAIAIEPNDLIYHNNKNAVYVEMGSEYYDKVLESSQDLLTRRYEINSANPGGASFEKVAKVYLRMASIHEKKKDFAQAKELYNKALTEDNNKTTRNALRELERIEEKFIKESYLDPVKAEEEREKGNELFKAGDTPGAKVHYDEAIKRNPKDAKLYSNRAAALTKLNAYPDALKDLEECIKLDPAFVKAYSRKGAAHYWMKEYHKALKAYGDGLKIDPTNKECLEGQEQVLAKIQETNKSGEVDEEQIRHAMADPEIQSILKDPQMNIFLKQLQEDPVNAQKAMAKDPKISEAVSKLMAAGILRTG